MPYRSWFIRLVKFFFPQRKPIARLSRIPLIGALMDWLFFEGDAVVYLPKDRVVIAQAIPPVQSTALPSAVVDTFIEAASYHWIMDFCLCRESEACQKYPIDLGCIFLGEAVLKIDPRLGHLATKEETLAHARRAREAGLVQLIGRNRIDDIWLGVGPVNQLLTICNCCECCCAYRILPDLHPRISQRIERMPGVIVQVDPTRCAGCGLCVQCCFVDAIQVQAEQAVISGECRGCGRCVEVCPEEAILLTLSDDAAIQNTIRQFSALVNVNGKSPSP
jgi:ferredoxin